MDDLFSCRLSLRKGSWWLNNGPLTIVEIVCQQTNTSGSDDWLKYLRSIIKYYQCETKNYNYLPNTHKFNCFFPKMRVCTPYIYHYSKTSFWLNYSFHPKSSCFFLSTISNPCALADPLRPLVRPCITQLLLDLFHLWRTNPVLPSVPCLFQVIDWWNLFFGVRKQSTKTTKTSEWLEPTLSFFNLMNVFEFRLYRTNYIDSFHFFCICYYLFLTYAASHLELRKKTN